jgi:hypothetical protein
VSAWLLALVAIIYLAVAIDQNHQGNTGFALMYFAYALANIGAILAVVRL